MYIFLVSKNDDVESCMKKAKERMMRYAYGEFKDGEAFYNHRMSALVYRDILNEKLGGTEEKFKVYKVCMTLLEEVERTNEEEERVRKCKSKVK